MKLPSCVGSISPAPKEPAVWFASGAEGRYPLSTKAALRHRDGFAKPDWDICRDRAHLSSAGAHLSSAGAHRHPPTGAGDESWTVLRRAAPFGTHSWPS